MSVIANATQEYRPLAFWQGMKEKYKNIVEARDETEAAFEFLAGMFEYEGFPDTVDTDFLESYFLSDGCASIRKDTKGDDEYRAMQASPGGTPDAYGIGEKVFSRTSNGHVYEDKRSSEEVAFGWNNKTKTPCMDAYRVGSYIAEIDTSLDLLVWWSRASRLFLADDNKAITMLQEAFAGIKKGAPMTVKSSNLLKEIETGKKTLEAIDLTDTKMAETMDRLAFIRECRFKWFKERYGMDSRNTGKKAQVSVEEAEGDTGASMVFPLNMLYERQKFCEECNRKFGWNSSVHFAGAWLGEIERYETTVVENGKLDIDGYDAIMETEDKKEGETNEETGSTETSGEVPERENESSEDDGTGSEDKDGKE